MRKGILATTLVISTILVNVQIVLGATSGGNDMLAGGYQVKMHPEGHIALFMKKPLVYTNPHLWAAYLIVMLLLGVAALILLYKQKDKELELAQGRAGLQDQPDLLKLQEKQDALLRRIKQLDAEYKAGDVDEQQYQETREKYKQLLVQVKLQLQKLS